MYFSFLSYNSKTKRCKKTNIWSFSEACDRIRLYNAYTYIVVSSKLIDKVYLSPLFYL